MVAPRTLRHSIPAQRAIRTIDSPHGPRPLSAGANRPARLGRMAGFDVGDGTCAEARP